MIYNKPEVTRLEDAGAAIQTQHLYKDAMPTDGKPDSEINSVAAYEADE